MTLVIMHYDGHHSQGWPDELSIKEMMVSRAAVLLARRGLQRTSFSEILEAAGAPRGSLYHHFPGGKDELVASAVKVAGDRMLGVLDELDGRPAVDVANAFAGFWRTILLQTDCSTGCAVTAVAIASDAPELLGTSGYVFRQWLGRLEDLLVAGGVAPARGAALAASLIAALEGAIVIARAQRSLEIFDRVAEEQVAAIVRESEVPS